MQLSTVAHYKDERYLHSIPMQEHTGVRDELARERTALANERTLLSYGRTALGVFALALFVFKFAPTDINIALGTAISVAAVLVYIYGLRRYKSTSSRISS